MQVAKLYPRFVEGRTRSGQCWQMHTGDASKVLKNIPSESIHCVVTSPPYFWLRDYKVEGQIGKEDTVGEYVEHICDVMNEVYRVLRPDGTVFLNLSDTYYSGKGASVGKDKKNRKRRFGLRAVDKSGGLGIDLQRKTMIGVPWRVATALTMRKWVLRSAIIWINKKRTPETVKDRPRQSYEHIFMFAKKRKYYFDRKMLESYGEEDVWYINERPKLNGIDTAPYPDELVERCVRIGCPIGGTVLDPFAGSGTTLRVATNIGRNAVGIDLNSVFCDYINKQLSSQE